MGILSQIRAFFSGVDTRKPAAGIDHDQLYHAGSACLYPYCGMGGDPEKPVATQDDRDQVANGIVLLKQVVDVNTDNWPALWLLGQAHAALGEPLLAYAQLRKAHDVNPGNRGVLADLATQATLLGRLDEARELTRRGLGGKKDDPAFLALLAVIQLQRGEKDAAAAAAEKALAHGNDARVKRIARRIQHALSTDASPPADDLLAPPDPK